MRFTPSALRTYLSGITGYFRAACAVVSPPAAPVPRTPRAPRRGRRRGSPALRSYSRFCENLEARTLLSTVSWIANQSGSWDNPANWSTGLVPTAVDDVIIDRSGGNGALTNRFTIAVTGNDAAHSVQSKEAIDISGGTLSVATASTEGGTFTLENNGTLNAGASFTLTGTSNWNAGVVTGTLVNAGTLGLGGGDHILSGASVTNQAIATQFGGRLSLQAGSTFTNAAIATYDLQSENGFEFYQANGGTNAFVNAGLLEKSVGTGATVLAAPVNITGGTVNVLSGEIILNGGNSTGGTLNAQSNATLDLTGGATSTYTGTYTGSGAGTVGLFSGTLDTGTGSGITFNFPAGLFQWGNANMTDTGGAKNIGSMTFVGGDKNLYSTTFNNNGTIIQAGGRLGIHAGSTFNNQVGATYNLQSENGNEFYQADGGTNSFNNFGLLEKTVGTGITTLNAPVNTLGGTVYAATGVIDLTTGVNTGGTYNADAGAVIDLTSGNSATYQGTYTGSGAGTVGLFSGTLNVGTGATFNFPGSGFQWGNANVVQGTTSTGLTNTAFMTFIGGDKNLYSTTFNNNGTIIQAGGRLGIHAGSTFNNAVGAIYNIQSENGNEFYQADGGTNNFNNFGLIEKTAGTGITILNAPVNILGGTVDSQTGTIGLTTGVSTGGTLNAELGAAIDLNSGNTNTLSGTYTGTGGGNVNLTSGQLQTNSGATFNFPSGMFQWGQANIFSDAPGHGLTNAAFMTLVGGEHLLFTTTFTNQGTIFQVGGRLGIRAGSTFNNLVGTTYNIQSENGNEFYSADGGSNNFNNFGLLEKTVGNGTASLNAPVNILGGTVDSQAGVIGLSTGVSTGGTLNAETGAAIDLTSGNTNTLTGTYTGTGGGNINLTSGQLQTNSGATFNFPSGMFQWGQANILSDGPADGLTNAAYMTLVGGEHLLFGTTFTNKGTMFQTGGRLGIRAGSTFNNLTGAIYNIQSENSNEFYAADGGSNNFNDYGLLEKTVGTGTASLNSPVNILGGTVDSQTGTIGLSTGLSTGGTLDAEIGAAIDLTSGNTNTFIGTYSGTGGGNINLLTGQLQTNSGATFNFPKGMFQWGQANIVSDGPADGLTNMGDLTLLGGEHLLFNTTFTNTGTITQNDGRLGIRQGSTFINAAGASYSIRGQNSNEFYSADGGTNIFTNKGLLEANVSGGSTALNAPIDNQGTVQVDGGTLFLSSVAQVSADGGTLTGGTWIVNGGSALSFNGVNTLTSNAANVTLNGGGISQFSALQTNSGFLKFANETFSSKGNFTNSGLLELGAAAIVAINGNFTQTSNATLREDIGGTPVSGNFGELTVTQQAVLGGTLDVRHVNGFGPTTGQSYTAATYPGELGSFSSVTGDTGLFSTSVGGTSLFINSIASGSDLAVQTVTPPASATIGRSISVTYTVKNISNNATGASAWTDAVYLSTSATLSSSAILLGTIGHSGALAFNGSYTQTFTGNVPNIGAGNYFVIVQTDVGGVVADTNIANNSAAAGSTTSIAFSGGPFITAQSLNGDVGAPINHIDFTFNEPINPGTLVPSSVVLIGPAGGLTITLIQQLSSSVYRATFAPLATNGTYTVTVANTVQDTAGNRMDQNGNGVGGEIGDGYTGTFIFHATGVSVVSQSLTGTVAGGVTSINVTFTAPIQLSTLNSGTITLTGPNGAIAITGTSLISGSTYAISFASQSASGSYTLVVGPNVLDATGLPMNQNGNATSGEPTDKYTGNFTIDSIGPKVTAASITTSVSSPFAGIIVTFSEPVIAGTVNSGTISMTGPGASVIAIASVTPIDSTHYQINFARQTTLGSYTLTVGPGVTDLVGNAMDQNNNGVNGEIGDAYVNTFTLAQANLTATAPNAPASAPAGSSISPSFTITNAGNAAATGNWADSLVLSHDGVYGNADDVVLQTLTHNGPLAVGASYIAQFNAQIPFGISGNYTLFLITDSGNVLNQFTHTDDLASTTINVGSAIDPNDLKVTSVTSPAAAQSGNAINVSWTVANNGTSTTTNPAWTDRVILSLDSTQGNNDDITLGDFVHNGAIPSGGNYSTTQSVTLPVNIAGGTYHIFVVTDVNNAIVQPGDAADKIGLSATPLLVTLSPVPDLAATSVLAPASVVIGQPMSITYTVSNVGGATAIPPGAGWIDRLYLSTDGTLNNAVVLGSFAHTSSLSNTGANSYTNTVTVTVPVGADAGDQIILVTDSTGVIFERGATANNTAFSGTVAITHPNLIVPSVTTVAGATSGGPLTVNWTVQNNGSGATVVGSTITDKVYLATGTTVDANAVLLTTVTHTGSVAANGSYAGTANVTLPNGITGTFHIVVVTNADGAVIEGPQANGGTGASGPLAVTLAPYADLGVSNVTAPPLLVGDPVSLAVSWTVTNSGTGTGTVSNWVDRVILSTNSAPGLGGDIVVGEFAHSGLLSVNGSYTQSQTVLLPPTTQGHYNLFVVTNATGTVYEGPNTASNIASPNHFVDVVTQPYADLVVDTVNAPATGLNGKPITVSWSVTNDAAHAIGPTNTTQWNDTIYISSDPTGATGLTQIGFLTHVGALGIGQSYQATTQVTLPSTASGKEYIFVQSSGPFVFIYTQGNVGRSAVGQRDLRAAAAFGARCQDRQRSFERARGHDHPRHLDGQQRRPQLAR